MVDKFKVIEIMNEATLQLLKEKNENYEINSKITEYLKDEAFFFKISKERAIEILKNVGVHQEQLEKVYKELIAPEVYNSLISRGKIKQDDSSLIVKYDSYNNIFKNN